MCAKLAVKQRFEVLLPGTKSQLLLLITFFWKGGQAIPAQDKKAIQWSTSFSDNPVQTVLGTWGTACSANVDLLWMTVPTPLFLSGGCFGCSELLHMDRKCCSRGHHRHLLHRLSLYNPYCSKKWQHPEERHSKGRFVTVVLGRSVI